MIALNNIRKYFVEYFSLNDYLISQDEAENAIREGVTFRGTNILILILAIFIASLGLNTNSTAVIIGAMLISPLMGPIIGIGLGVGIQDFELIKRSLRNLVMATGFSVLTSTLYFLISPVSEGHSELLARTSPTIYDVLIGLFGGGAGIIAIGSKSKGNVIPGVAIATALMYSRLRHSHFAAQLLLRRVLPFPHQFNLHSSRHIHRREAHALSPCADRHSAARPQSETHSLYRSDPHNAPLPLPHLQYA